MLYSKNKFYFLVALIIFIAACNNHEKKSEADNTKNVIDSVAPVSNKTFTILLSGLPPPPMYSNALDIMEKVYNIDFVYAAGCIVSDRLGDSISTCNVKTFKELDKHYHQDLSTGLFGQLDKETHFLNSLDSTIRNKESIKKTYEVVDKSIYYIKKDKNYLAHFISTIPDGKVLTFRLNLIMTIDSATKNITGTVLKDSLIDFNFRNLSND
ncbi:MAG: hypothetical protein Q8L81_04435 [Bacteroidota bacterium]|nr:hypothetical protein [Bacteroidota bacterium]